jgi:ribosomal-protein-alanine N-acetyltransferase
MWTWLVALGEFEPGSKIVAGFVLGMWIPPEAELTKIAVDPKWRGRGIASSLIGMILREARERECSVCYLEVRASNQAAIHLYRKCGFVFLRNRKNYYANPQEDAWIMACDLTTKP